MDFTIYSIGDTAFLYEVVMGLRRMFDFGFSSLHILIGTTALLSLMVLIVKSWINPNSNPVLSWFIGLCIFMILCGPMSKVDITIESIRTGDVYYVNDAPGIAAIAAMMTSGLYGLSTDYENAFASAEGYKAGQFLDPLRALVAIDTFGYMDASETVGEFDKNRYKIGTSVEYYLVDCVLWDINTGGINQEISADDLKNMPLQDLLYGIRTNTESRTTMVQLNSLVPQEKTCPDAYDDIKDTLESAKFRDYIDEFLKSMKSDITKLQNGLPTITGAGASISAYNLAVGKFLSHKLAAAAAASNKPIALRSELTMIETKSQRHYQMASDRGLWMELSIGIATFLEGFVFFIIPLIAIILVMGAESMKSAAMFFGVTLWVNLWPVTMTAVNLFTLLAIEGRFSDMTMTGTGTSATTFGMWGDSIASIESWLAVSGALAAAVPMITLYILHKGVHTMMGVAGKTAPDTNIDAKKMSPDIATAPNGGSTKQGDIQLQAGGAPSTFAEFQKNGGVNGPVDFSQNSSAGVESPYLKSVSSEVSQAGQTTVNQSNAEAKTQAYNETLSESRSSVLDSIKGLRKGDSFTQSDTSNLTEEEAYTASQVHALASQTGMSQEDAYSLVTSGALNAEAGIGFGVSASSGKSKSTKGPNVNGTRDAANRGASGSFGLKLGAGARAALEAKAGNLDKTSISEQYSDEERAQMAEILKSSHNNSVSTAKQISSENSKANKQSNARQENLATTYGESVTATAMATEGQTASDLAKSMLTMNAAEVQNSHTGTDAEFLDKLAHNPTMTNQMVHTALANTIGEEELAKFGTNNDLKRDALSSILQTGQYKSIDGEMKNANFQGNFNHHKDNVNTGDGARYPEAQKNNIATANTIQSLTGAMARNNSIVGFDSEGKKIPQSSPIAALKQAQTERSVAGTAIRELGEQMGSASLVGIGNELLNGVNNPSAMDDLQKPKNTTGIDSKQLSKETSAAIKTDPTQEFKPEENKKAMHAQRQQGQEQVQTESNKGQGQIKTDAKPLVEAGDNLNAKKLSNQFEGLKMLSGETNAFAANLVSGLGELVKTPITDNIKNIMEENKTTANSELASIGFGVLSNNTPEAIRGLLNDAANGNSSHINGRAVNPTEAKMLAGAVGTAMLPESQSAFKQALTTDSAKLDENNPNNPYAIARDNIQAINGFSANEKVSDALDDSLLLSTYATVANLSEGQIEDAVSATRGESTFFNDREYGTHLSNLNMIADKMGIDQQYDTSQYQNITDGKSALRDSIVNGNYDSSASSLARLAIENYQNTGSSDGIDISDVNKFDKQQIENSITPSYSNSYINPNTIKFTPESIADSEKIIDNLRLGGFKGEADSLEASLQTLRQQELNNTGYERSGFAQSQEEVVNTALSQNGLSDESKVFAKQAIHGHSELPNIGAQHLDDLNKIYNRLDGAPEAQLKLVEAMSAQFRSDSKEPGTNSVVESAQINSGEVKQGTDTPRSSETFVASSNTEQRGSDNTQPNVATEKTSDAQRSNETLVASSNTEQPSADSTQPNVAATTTDVPRSNESLVASSNTGQPSADRAQPTVAAATTSDVPHSSETFVASSNTDQRGSDNTQPNVATEKTSDAQRSNETLVASSNTGQTSADSAQPTVAGATTSDAQRSNESLVASSNTGQPSAVSAQPNVAAATTTDTPRSSETFVASSNTEQRGSDNTQPTVAAATTTDVPRSSESLVASSNTEQSSADITQPNVAATTTDVPRSSESLVASSNTEQSSADITQPNVVATTTDVPRSSESLVASSNTEQSSADNTQPTVAAATTSDAQRSNETLMASSNTEQSSAVGVEVATTTDRTDESLVVSTPQTQGESLAARRDAFENTQISDISMQAAKDILTFGSLGAGEFSEEQKAELSELADNLQANNLNLDALEIRKAIEA